MKILSVKLKTVIITAVIIIAVAAAIFLTSVSLTDSVSSEVRLIPIYNVETASGKVAISFNCANGNSDIDEILSILEAYNVKATFFLLGSWAENYVDEVTKIFESGHEIGSHGYSHNDLPSMSYENILLDIQKSGEIIRSITGIAPSLFRAPSGSYDNKTINAAEELGMTAIQWDVDSLDWKNISSDEIYERVTSKVKSGSIIQFHTGTDHTAETLPLILDYMIEKHMTPVSVGSLILKNNYRIDNSGKQIECITEKTT